MYITIDIGGTNTRCATATSLNKLENIQKQPTPNDINSLRELLTDYVNKFDNVEAISIGSAGLIDSINNLIIRSPHIKFFNNTPISDLIPIQNIPLYLNNDAALAGLAEANDNSLKHVSRIAYITISTGVGGTIIVNGKLPAAQYNLEPGHHIIDIGGKALALENIKGSLESYASGTALKKIYGTAPRGNN